MSIVSNNIKYLRRLHGLTQEQFSRRIGIKRSLLGAYEESRANPSQDNLLAITRMCNVSIDDFLKKDLRRLKETPDLNLIGNGNMSSTFQPSNIPASPLMKDEPKPIAELIDKVYQPPKNVGSWPPSTLPPAAPKPPELPKAPMPEPPIVQYQQPLPPVFQPVAFNNVYEKGINVVPSQPIEVQKPTQQAIQFVRQSQLSEYIDKYQNSDFLRQLPTFQPPILPEGQYRAFEAGPDFAFAGAFLIGSFVKNWYEIADGKYYVIIARGLAGSYRRVFSQAQSKGTVLLSSDKAHLPTIEVPLKEIIEMWEVKSFYSTILPDPTPSLDHLRNLSNQLQEELKRMGQ
jgi:transcriptional regulator with XRE-family HTH domain